MKNENRPTTIRGLDLKVRREAKASAARRGITVGQWWSEAGREKLNREKAKGE